MPAEEIVERSLLRLANEGAKILAEGIALRASDIDTMYLNGYGFPAWRGGPMWQADHIGPGQGRRAHQGLPGASTATAGRSRR